MKWIWTIWLFILLPVSFAAFEAYALVTGGTTLSRYIWDISAAFPPFSFFAGFLTGFLACHFWWGGITSFKPVEKEEDNGRPGSDRYLG
jgi:hypothetical protein